MRRLSIELAPFSMRREWYRIRPSVRLLALAGALLCTVGAYRAQTVLVHLHALERESTQIVDRNERAAHASQRVHSEPIDVKQAAAVNLAVARLNLPWDNLLDAVEAATPTQIALMSITPEPGRALIRIEAECASSKDMLDYLSSLGRQPILGRVTLTRHELVKDGMDNVLRFQVEVQWRGTVS
ncbi:pilus assembly protein [Burkholderia sp. Ac-20365]|uniref:pilus assembly protein n=1 Tax=Burkholderia sp. Ac-20365 TaxID=2703897 RepID=UPI00197B49A2|nr:pilus assembly protein [Burkholderia sp. Ac-20365]MBN3759281.1 PilN domain-containing protein [Burkholderia sp. Ac-20365]